MIGLVITLLVVWAVLAVVYAALVLLEIGDEA